MELSDSHCLSNAKNVGLKEADLLAQASPPEALGRAAAVCETPQLATERFVGNPEAADSIEDLVIHLEEEKDMIVGGNNEIIDMEAKGTINIVTRLESEKKIVYGCDSRLTLDEIIKKDKEKKFDLITPNVIATMVGSGGGCQKIWRHMKAYCEVQKDEENTIHAISECGSKIPREASYKYSSECFVMGIENDKPTIYYVKDLYNDKDGKRVQDSVEVEGTFATLGSEELFALNLLKKELEGKNLNRNVVIHAVLYVLLSTALRSPDIGGILRVIQLGSPTTIEEEINTTVVDQYLNFYNCFRDLEDRSFFIFYIPIIKHNDLLQWLRKSGEVKILGHPLTRLHGRYYMQRVLFKNPIALNNLVGTKSIPKPKLPKFTDTPKKLRLVMIGTKNVFAARQSEAILRSLRVDLQFTE